MKWPSVSKRDTGSSPTFNAGPRIKATALPKSSDDAPEPWVQECFVCGYQVTLFDSEYDTTQNRNYLLCLGWTERPGIGWRCSRCSKP